METIKRIIRWIVKSSEDPEKISLTLRGLASTIIPMLVLFNFGTLPDINMFVDGIILLIVLLAGGITWFVTFYGLIRKFKNTWFNG